MDSILYDYIFFLTFTTFNNSNILYFLNFLYEISPSNYYNYIINIWLRKRFILILKLTLPKLIDHKFSSFDWAIFSPTRKGQWRRRRRGRWVLGWCCRGRWHLSPEMLKNWRKLGQSLGSLFHFSPLSLTVSWQCFRFHIYNLSLISMFAVKKLNPFVSKFGLSARTSRWAWRYIQRKSKNCC